ncbi:MAG: peptide synthetase [Mesorhizobium amorphae]|nr:MAG: peptide synthetase [Mesorhizobium amorphae]
MSAAIRRIVMITEEVLVEGGKALDRPIRRAAAVAVIENPYADAFAEDLTELIEAGAELGRLLPERAVQALGIAGEAVHSFGKAALVGAEGELEHAAALLHPRLGAPFRDVLGKGASLIPSSKKRGRPGAPFDVPLNHKDAAKVRSHFDGMEILVPDAPRENEIAVAIAVTDGGRPHPRVGGLELGDVKGEDGLV